MSAPQNEKHFDERLDPWTQLQNVATDDSLEFFQRVKRIKAFLYMGPPKEYPWRVRAVHDLLAFGEKNRIPLGKQKSLPKMPFEMLFSHGEYNSVLTSLKADPAWVAHPDLMGRFIQGRGWLHQALEIILRPEWEPHRERLAKRMYEVEDFGHETKTWGG